MPLFSPPLQLLQPRDYPSTNFEASMTMILILKNLPIGFTACELSSLTQHVLNEIAISSRPLIRKTEVMVLFDRQKGEFEFYGLIFCNDRQHGQTTRALFENFLHQGYVIEVAEFFHRQANEQVSTTTNRRRIPDKQLLIFKSVEEIEIFPALELTQQTKPKSLH